MRILHCSLQVHPNVWREELLVGSGRVQGWKRLRARMLEVRSRVHVNALVGKADPCCHL